uniref:Reverse transcriptase domain-containing protein n=1 Tax=Strongyloides papillosus TaxID=174720 RepID=A0A0N5CGX6_STREA
MVETRRQKRDSKSIEGMEEENNKERAKPSENTNVNSRLMKLEVMKNTIRISNSNQKNNDDICDDDRKVKVKSTLSNFKCGGEHSYKIWTNEEYKMIDEFIKICPVKNGKLQYKEVKDKFLELMKNMNNRTASRVQSEIRSRFTNKDRKIPNYVLERRDQLLEKIVENDQKSGETRNNIKKSDEKKMVEIDKNPVVSEGNKENQTFTFKKSKMRRKFDNMNIEERFTYFCNLKRLPKVRRFDPKRPWIPVKEIDLCLMKKIDPLLISMKSNLSEKGWKSIQKKAKMYFKAALLTMKTFDHTIEDMDGFKVKKSVKLKKSLKRQKKLLSKLNRDKKSNNESAKIRNMMKNNHIKNMKELIDFQSSICTTLEQKLHEHEVKEQNAKIRYMFNKHPSLKVLSKYKRKKVPIPVNEAVQFFSKIHEKDVNKKMPMFKEWLETIPKHEVEEDIFDSELLSECIKWSKGWKSVGPDNVQAIIYKITESGKAYIKLWIQRVLSSNLPILKTDVTGCGFMIPKKCPDDVDCNNYRVIVAANGDYKLLRAYLYRYVMEKSKSILDKYQYAGIKNIWGTADCMIRNQHIQQNLSIKEDGPKYQWYCDIKKAFDTCSGSAIRLLINNLPLSNQYKKVLMNCLEYQSVQLVNCLKPNINGKIKNTYKLHSGIQQGDSLSPLIFELLMCSTMYHIKKVSTCETPVIAFMDDMKGFSPTIDEMNKQIEVTKAACREMNLELSIQKCGWNKIGGKLNNEDESKIDEIEYPLIRNCYKYLGVEEDCDNVNNQNTMKKIENKIEEKLVLILSSCLNTNQIIKAINTIIIPAYGYILMQSSGKNLKQLLEMAERMDQIIRTHMTIPYNSDSENRLRNKNSSLARLYMNKKTYGLNLMQIKVQVWKELMKKFVHLVFTDSLKDCFQGFYESYKKGIDNIVGNFLKMCDLLEIKKCKIEENKIVVDGKVLDNEGDARKWFNEKIDLNINDELLYRWKQYMSYSKSMTEFKLQLPWMMKVPFSQGKTRKILEIQQENVPLLTHCKNNPNSPCVWCNGKSFDTALHITSQCKSQMALNCYRDRHDEVLKTIANNVRLCLGAKPLNMEALRNSFDEEIKGWKIQIDKMLPYDLVHRKPDLIIYNNKYMYIWELGITANRNRDRVKKTKYTKYCVNSTINVDELNYDKVSVAGNLLQVLKKEHPNKKIIYKTIVVGPTGELDSEFESEIYIPEIFNNKRKVEKLKYNVSVAAVSQTEYLVRKYQACKTNTL